MSMTVNEIELIEGLAQEERMPKHIIGMDAHSRKVSLCISEARYGRDPLILRELSDVQLEHLGLDPWKCVIFRRLVCLLLFIC